jgi:hypothetical protein
VCNQPEEHDSPGLGEIFGSLDPEAPCRILDLGPALRLNLELYATIASKVRIVDLFRNDSPAEMAALEDDSFVHRLTRLLPIGDDLFDVILTWDLFDYFDREQPSLLASHLAAVADHGARLHAMVVTVDSMPAKPTRYEIRQPGRLAYLPTTTRSMPAPNSPPALVERWLAPFRVERSIVLRHGVRESIGVFG